MEYTVYLRTNLVNGKQYVGQTNNFRKREIQWKCLKNRYANQYIVEDREKYGLDNWKSEVLATVETREEAWEVEQKYIAEYCTIYPNGYNLTEGGEGGKLFVKGQTPWNKGLTKEKDCRVKGVKQSAEWIEKRAKAKRIPVYQYTLDGKLVAIWPSAKDAEEELGFDRTGISMCCHGKRKSAGGFKWMHKEDYDKMQ